MDNWEAETLNISGIVDDSIVDGPGLRYTILPYIIKQENGTQQDPNRTSPGGCPRARKKAEAENENDHNKNGEFSLGQGDPGQADGRVCPRDPGRRELFLPPPQLL